MELGSLVHYVRRVAVDTHVRLAGVGVVACDRVTGTNGHERWHSIQRHRHQEVVCWSAYQSDNYVGVVVHDLHAISFSSESDAAATEIDAG